MSAPRASTNAGEGGPARITGRAVSPLTPLDGPVHVLLVGEAPGPRGADKSGVPFFGDAAGQHLYRALREMGAVTMPSLVDELPWDGAAFAGHALIPTAHGIALGNAFDRCPTDDGHHFRAPSRAELRGAENVQRLAAQIRSLMQRELRGIVTMGRVAATTVDDVLAQMQGDVNVDFVPAQRSRDSSVTRDVSALIRRAVVHPSARGLISMLRGRPRGAPTKMPALQAEWITLLTTALREAGFAANDARRSGAVQKSQERERAS